MNNTLALNPSLAYASTAAETWHIISFFLDLVPVDIGRLSPRDRTCSICHEAYTDDHSHRAVSLPCGHCFGDVCIEKWLTPFLPWTPHAGFPVNMPTDHPGAHTCPICRGECFRPQLAVDCLPELEGRIALWDWAYGLAGVAMSARERVTRDGMLRYIRRYMVRGFDEYYPADARARWAKHRFIMRVVSLDFYSGRTPLQRVLTRRLQVIARRLDEGEISWPRSDQGALLFRFEGRLGIEPESGEIRAAGESGDLAAEEEDTDEMDESNESAAEEEDTDEMDESDENAAEEEYNNQMGESNESAAEEEDTDEMGESDESADEEEDTDEISDERWERG